MWDEKTLSKNLVSGSLLPFYFLFGDEPFLASAYADKIAALAVGGDELKDFNLHKFDGQECGIDGIIEAAEALPLMGSRSCVVVRDFDASGSGHDRLMELAADPPPDCVTVFWIDSVKVDRTKNVWKHFIAAAEKSGTAVRFGKKAPGELAELLISRAGERGCLLRPDTARLMAERGGTDLNLQFNELDKLAALAGGGVKDKAEITKAMVEAAGTRSLEANVFDISNAILAKQPGRAFDVLHRLFEGKADAVKILGALASSFINLYQTKAAAASGERTEALAAIFPDKNANALRYAARDAARIPLPALRECLEALAAADRRLKSFHADDRTVLEYTVAKLIELI